MLLYSAEQIQLIMEKSKLWQAYRQLSDISDVLKKEVPHCPEAEFMLESVEDLKRCMKSAHDRLSIK